MSNKQDLIEEICEKITNSDIPWYPKEGDLMHYEVFAEYNNLFIVVTNFTRLTRISFFDNKNRDSVILEMDVYNYILPFNKLLAKALSKKKAQSFQGEISALSKILSNLKSEKPTA